MRVAQKPSTAILCPMPTYKRLLIAWLFVPLHRLLFRLSRGRILGRLEGTGVLILVTTGRRSGKPYSSPLLYFEFKDSEDLIVIASNYGQDIDPNWYLNIQVNPMVSVEMGGESFAAEARIAEGRERAELYDKVVEKNGRFANYPTYTDREIPVVTLRRI